MKDNKYLNENENGDVTMNNTNKINFKEILGVEYVNTTHEEYVNRYIKNGTLSTLRPFDATCEKVDKYTCSLTPHPDCFKPHVDEKDKDKKYGVIYYFPHYLIKSDYRIEPDVINTDMVDITHICSYPDDTIVLINKKDMNCNGFKRYILDTKADMLSCLNKLKIKFNEDPEKFVAYRQMVTMIQFINKYNKYIYISPNEDSKWILVHTLHSIDNGRKDYREYCIVISDGIKAMNTDVRIKNPSVLNNKDEATLKIKPEFIFDKPVMTTEKKPYISSYLIAVEDYRNDNPEYKYDVEMDLITKMSDKIDYKIASHDAFKDDLITNYNYNLRKLVKEFNEKADEIGIEKAWKTKVGFIILKYIDYIAEFRTEDMKPIKLYINEHKRLCFTDKVKKSEISDNFGTFVFNGTLPTPKNADYKYNPDNFKVEDDSDYITEPGSMIIIFNVNNLED